MVKRPAAMDEGQSTELDGFSFVIDYIWID
jgi:hypothetical protein